MHHSRPDFLSIEFWWSVWARVNPAYNCAIFICFLVSRRLESLHWPVSINEVPLQSLFVWRVAQGSNPKFGFFGHLLFSPIYQNVCKVDSDAVDCQHLSGKGSRRNKHQWNWSKAFPKCPPPPTPSPSKGEGLPARNALACPPSALPQANAGRACEAGGGGGEKGNSYTLKL